MSAQRDNYMGVKVRSFVPEITFSLNEGQSLDLLFYDQASQAFQINEQAMEVLLQYGGNVGFIMNLGQKGVGKSFLLNNVMDLDPSHNAFQEREKGIKMWTKPLFREEEFVYLFFVDVQGFDSDWNFKNFIWTFSFLLGSIVLYSTKGSLNDKTFEDLNSLGFVSQNLILAEDPTENEYLLSYYSPKVIWLLKDFQESGQEGKSFSPEKYLEATLHEVNREEANNQSVGYVKNFLINAFKDRSCINFPVIQSNTRFTDPLQRMPAAYSESVKILKERIYSKSLNKYFDGITITSKMMVHFIACVVELFNKQAPIVYSEM
jgi:hypothetical protein